MSDIARGDNAVSLFTQMNPDSSTKIATRQGWHAVRCSSLDDMRTQNIRFWQQAGGAKIREAAWDLVTETWKAQKRDLNELRFPRLAPVVRQA